MFRIILSFILFLCLNTNLFAIIVGENARYSIRYNTSLVHEAVFSPDSKTIITISPKKVQIWDTKTGNLIKTIGEHRKKPFGLTISKSGNYAASASSEFIKIWDLNGKRLSRKIISGSSVEHIAISPDDKTLAVSQYYSPRSKLRPKGKKGYLINFYSMRTGRKAASIIPAGYPGGMLYTKDGKYLIVALSGEKRYESSGLEIYHAGTKKLAKYFKTRLPATKLAISPDGKVIATSTYVIETRAVKPATFIYGYDIKSGKNVFRMKGPKNIVTGLSFDPTSRYLASSQIGGRPEFWVWDTKKKTAHYKRKGRRHSMGIAFSPDGRSLLVMNRTSGNLGNPSRMDVYDCGTRRQLSATGALNDINTFRINGHVRARINGRWYSGKINKKEAGQYLLKMDNRRPKYWKWVFPKNLRGMNSKVNNSKRYETGRFERKKIRNKNLNINLSFPVGSRVMVSWKGKWYKATILKKREGAYYIKYDRYSSSWNEWANTNRIKRR